ncbi:cadherin-like domain-containing protein [Hydrogenophaga sp. PAMC20947]|uniref:cadherin-like domain-containing protein n=1 Tax=Hydrogenophaga sp. PAMC20947 TaxID=2565558 RepID=UPI0014470D2C|nr:cadherin-like domain-containing protein [Hydrogenophaga sp. PAMC20947]
MEGDDLSFTLPDIGQPPTPGDPIAVIADAGEGTMTDGGLINDYGASEQRADPPDPVIHTDEATGWSWFQDGEGNTTYVSPSGQVVTQAQYEAANYQDNAAALNIISSVYNGVENWANLNDVQRLSTLANLYSQIDQLGSAISGLDLGAKVAEDGNLPGELGSTAGGLSGALTLYNGLENGNALQVISGGIQLGNAVGSLVGDGSSSIVSNAIADSTIGQSIGISAGQVVPIINLLISLDDVEDNPWGTVAAAAACFPPIGTFIAAFITVIQIAFPTDIPPTIGEAEAHIDPDGNIAVNTTIDEEGGGSYAAHWADALAHMAVAAGMTAPQAGAAAQHLPSVGYYFDPDGVNLSDTSGQLELRWVDENGNQRQRIYDANGMAWDGNTVAGQSDIMRDYQLLITNLEPRWPPVMYQQVAGGILQLDYGVATVLYATALGSFDGQIAHTHGGEEDTDGGVVELGADSALIYSLQTNTIANSSEQTEQTLTSQDLRSVPPSTGIGNSANGPQVPRGKDPIVFVPVQAMVGNRTVTDGMVSSLGASDAQLAALAIAMGAGGLPFMAHAQGQTGNATNGGDGQDSVSVNLSAGQTGGYAWGIAGADLNTPTGAVLTPGGWTDANGQAIDTPPLTTPATPLGAGAVQTPELVSEPPAFEFDGKGNTVGLNGTPLGVTATLPDGYGSQDNLGNTAAVLEPNSDTVLDFPTVQDDHLQGTEDQTLRFSAQDLLGNDSTPNPVPKGLSGDYFNGMRIVSVGDASHGSVGIQNGQLVFVPDANYNGPAGFSYTIVDMYGLTHSGTVTVMVAEVNDRPEARGESATGSEDTDLVFTAAALLANDRDIDGDKLSISRVGEASGGTVLLQPDGSVRFVPTPNYNGPAGYTYWVSDGQEQVPARVNLNILQVNDLPVVQGELVASDEDVVLNFPFSVLLANDSDIDIDIDPVLNQAGAQVLTISAVGNALHGSVAIVDAQVRFTPEANYFGPASFDYLVDDGAGGQVSTTVVLNLAPVNDAPDVMGETATLAEDNTLIYTQAELLVNDSDVDNPHGDLVISQVGGAQNGSVEILPDGRIRFTPDADYFGPAQFDYLVDDGVGGQSLATVALDITPVNDAPRLVGEQVSLDEDTVVTVSTADLLANDSDVDNPHADLQITGVGNAVNGTVTLDASGNVSFAPTLNFYGQASFTYTVSDGVGGTSTTSMVLDYASVNDLPVVNDELLLGKRNNTYILTAESLLRNDTDVEHPTGLQIVAVGNAENGTVSLLPDGRIQFVPEGDYASWDPSQFGRFEYTVRDPDGGETVGHADIDYSRVNVNPIAVDDHFQGYEDVRLEINVGELLRNDSDPDTTGLTSLQVTAVAGATHGTVSLNNGVVTFNPTRDYSGAAQFRYQVDDGEGGTTWATAYIDLERENRPPVIDSLVFLGGTLSTPGNTSLTYADPGFWDNPVFYIGNTISVRDDHLVNGRIYAHDPDGDALTFSISPLNAPGHGQAFIGEHITTDAPRGLTLAQLQGRLPTFGFESGYQQTFTPSPIGTRPIVGLDPARPYGGAHDYFVDDERTTGAAYSAWQYVYTDARTGGASDQFIITVTDSRGASVTQVVTLNWGGAGYAPIVVDMGNNGLDLLPANYSMRYMDVDGDGVEERLGWVASSDALLAFDKDNNGLITDSDEISFVGYTPGARTDLEGLAAFDTNGDGHLTAEDEQWKQFGLLQDANDNGVQDEGEWTTLTDAGLTGMDLQREGTPELNNGNVVFGTTTLTYADGSTLTAGDVMFAGEGVAMPDWATEGLNVAALDSTSVLPEQGAETPGAAAAQVDANQPLEPLEDGLAGAAAVETLPAVQSSTSEPMGAHLGITEDTQSSLASPGATLADDAAIDRQAQLFVQTVTTQDQTSEPLGFVDASDMSLSPGDDLLVSADQAAVLPAVDVSSPSMMPA